MNTMMVGRHNEQIRRERASNSRVESGTFVGIDPKMQLKPLALDNLLVPCLPLQGFANELCVDSNHSTRRNDFLIRTQRFITYSICNVTVSVPNNIVDSGQVRLQNGITLWREVLTLNFCDVES